MNHRCRIHQFNISKIFALCLQGFSAIRFRVLVGSRWWAGEKPFGKNDNLPGWRPGRSKIIRFADFSKHLVVAR
jgi:hypothetical protein